MESLMRMMPSLVTLHSKFWEDPIIKTFPLALIPGGHVGNPVFDMLAETGAGRFLFLVKDSIGQVLVVIPQ